MAVVLCTFTGPIALDCLWVKGGWGICFFSAYSSPGPSLLEPGFCFLPWRVLSIRGHNFNQTSCSCLFVKDAFWDHFWYGCWSRTCSIAKWLIYFLSKINHVCENNFLLHCIFLTHSHTLNGRNSWMLSGWYCYSDLAVNTAYYWTEW